MKIKRFFAPDIRQAMRMVKEELGADAVIMSNRAVEGGIEIVAARDFDEQAVHNKLQEAAAVQTSEPKAKKITFPNFDDAKKRFHLLDSQKKSESVSRPEPASAPASASAAPVRQNLDAKRPEPMAAKSVASDVGVKRVSLPNFDAARKRLQMEEERKNAAALLAAKAERRNASPYVGYAEKAQLVKAPEVTAQSKPAVISPANNFSGFTAQTQHNPMTDSLLMEMSKELKYLRNAMDTKLANISWAHLSQHTPGGNAIQQRLTNIGISRKLSTMIAGQLADQDDPELGFIKAQDVLAQALPITDDNLLETGGIVALVGPTGVGKTTTIAKLAAQFILKHGSSQVALITTDNYRIGAHEQINTYGRILNVPVRVASCADDLRNIIQSFSNKRLILIDTAGMCQRDMKLVEQINTLRQNDLPIRTYLVMSAATEYKALNSIIKAFAVFEPKAAILTKLDEAIMVGPAVSSIIEHNLPLSFIADGQQVPEDFHHPDASALIRQCVVEAENEADEDDEAGYQPWGAQAYA